MEPPAERQERCHRWRDENKSAQPWFGMPGQDKEPLVPEKVISKNGDRKDLPGIHPAPRCQWQNPSAVPWMEHRAEDERRAHCPEQAAFPISNKEERNHHDRDDNNDVIMIILLVRIGPEGVFDHPPKDIVQTRDINKAP